MGLNIGLLCVTWALSWSHSQPTFGMPRSNVGTGALTTNFMGSNVSSTCNSSGSALWASAKNIKPLVDANCHTEAIEFACHQSLIRFSPIYYQNPGSTSRSPNGQTILFGCPLELCTVGGLKKVPPVLEYLLDSVRHHWSTLRFDNKPVGQNTVIVSTNSLDHKLEKWWHLVNELEQAWTGVEETDRAFISKQLPRGHRELVIVVCPL